MAKNSKPAVEISLRELHQLAAHQADAQLAHAKVAHAITSCDAIRNAWEVKRLQAALDAHEANEKARRMADDALATYKAAQKQLADLTAELRRTHNLTEKHAIDGATGAIILPEG